MISVNKLENDGVVSERDAAQAGKTAVPVTPRPTPSSGMASLSGLPHDPARSAGWNDATGGVMGASEDAIDNSNGAPRLPPPTLQPSSSTSGSWMDFADAALQLQAVQDALLTQRMLGAKNTIDAAMRRMSATQADQGEKLQEWIKNSAAAHKKSTSVLGWFSKVLTVVAAGIGVALAAAASAATGGLATPLMAIAIVGLVSATMNLANQISLSAGGPEISVSNLFGTVGKKVFTTLGMNQKHAEEAGDILGGIAGIATGAVFIDPQVVGMLTKGVAEVLGASASTTSILIGVANMMAVIATTVVLVAAGNVAGAAGAAGAAVAVADDAAIAALRMTGNVAKGVGGVTGGTDQVIQGVHTFNIGKAMERAGDAQADMKKNSAGMMKLQAQMAESRDEIKRILDLFLSSFTEIAQMIGGQAKTMQQIGQNIGVRIGA